MEIALTTVMTAFSPSEILSSVTAAHALSFTHNTHRTTPAHTKDTLRTGRKHGFNDERRHHHGSTCCGRRGRRCRQPPRQSAVAPRGPHQQQPDVALESDVVRALPRQGSRLFEKYARAEGRLRRGLCPGSARRQGSSRHRERGNRQGYPRYVRRRGGLSQVQQNHFGHSRPVGLRVLPVPFSAEQRTWLRCI